MSGRPADGRQRHGRPARPGAERPRRAPARRPRRAGRPGGRRPPARGGPGMMGMGMGLPPEKSKDFRGSFGRLLGRLRPEAPLIVLVVLLAVVSVTFAVLGPKILGDATNIIFEGVDRQAAPGRA